MTAQAQDLQPILARIEVLERQNRRLKQIAVGGLLLLAVALLSSALSAGGQQEPKERGTAVKQKAPAQPSSWQLADGRLVVFPSTVKKVEEVDATALDLPPGTKVIGWEPVEGASSLLPRYEARFATLPTMKDKLNSLANASDMLQTQIEFMKGDIKYAHARIGIEEKSSDGLAKVIDQIGALAADNDSRIRAIQLGYAGANPLKTELDDFKEAACPVLRTARMGELTKMKLDSACGLH